MKNRDSCCEPWAAVDTFGGKQGITWLVAAAAVWLIFSTAQAEDTSPEGEATPKQKEEQKTKASYPDPRHDIRGREEAALEAIRALPNGDVKLLALSELAARWIKSDPASAWSYSSQIKDGTLRATFLRGIMPHLVAKNPEQVLIKLEEGLWWPDQWMHIRDVTLKVAKDDLDRAIEVFEKSTPERARIDYVAMGVAAEIVRQRSSEAALEFADRQAIRKLKIGAYRGIAQALMENDEAAATVFVEDIEDEELRRAAVFGMVLGKGWEDDPSATVAWATGLAVDEMRRRALLEIAWQWSQSDQMAEVKALLENPDVVFDDRAYIEDRLKGAGVFLE